MKLTLIVVLVLCATQTSASFITDLLQDQNSYRTVLNLTPFTWSNDLAQSAQTWADHLASTGKLVHSGSSNGENLAYISGTYSGDTNLVDSSSASTTTSTTPATTTASTTPASTDTNSGNTVSGTTQDSSNTDNSGNGNTVSNGNDNSNNSNNNSNNNGNTVEEGQLSDSTTQSDAPQQEPEGSGQDPSEIPTAENPQTHWTHTNTHKSGSVDRYSFTNGDGGSSDGRKLSNGRNLDQDSSDSQLSRLVGLWGAEQQYFIDGTFPDVSSTGEWSDVGHYTQLVWAETKQVGCGISNGNGNVYLVCQYYPAGNWDGEKVY